MKSFSLSELNRKPGEVVEAAMAAPVVLTKRGKPKLVMMPASIYQSLRTQYLAKPLKSAFPESGLEPLPLGKSEE